MSTPVFDYDFSLSHGHKYFVVQQVITGFTDKAFAITVYGKQKGTKQHAQTQNKEELWMKNITKNVAIAATK